MILVPGLVTICLFVRTWDMITDVKMYISNIIATSYSAVSRASFNTEREAI